MQFSIVAEYFRKLDLTSSRLEMADILVQLFGSTPKEEIDKVAYLCLGQFTAEYEDYVLGIGDKLAIKAISMAAHRAETDVNKRFKELGDLGDVAETMLGAEKGSSLAVFVDDKKTGLTLNEVFDGLWKVANASGSRSQDLKLKTLVSLLLKAGPIEARYLVRVVLGTLRLGAGDMTVLDALASQYAEKKERYIVENAYNIHPDIGLISRKLAEDGLKGVESIGITVGVPIKMMAAQRVPKLEDISEKMNKFAVEEKYDGERVQIHKNGETIKIFSRRLENISEQYPDVIAAIRNQVSAKTAIMEGEVVAVKGDKLLPFQHLMQRKRKYDIERYIKKVPVRTFLFDLLYVDDKEFLKIPYPARREKLESIVKKSGDIGFAKRIISEDIDEIQKFFDDGLEHGAEGIMAKNLADNAIYRAGAREWLWIKWKKDYLEGLVDTFDLVVIGAFYGAGKRKGVYGTILCATYNSDEDSFESFCKVGTGFSDKMLAEMPKMFKPLERDKKPARVKTKPDMIPDVWIEPKFVMELTGAEITTSPVHSCAADELGKGLSLRFPRFKQFREKKAEQATSSREVLQMYGT